MLTGEFCQLFLAAGDLATELLVFSECHLQISCELLCLILEVLKQGEAVLVGGVRLSFGTHLDEFLEAIMQIVDFKLFFFFEGFVLVSEFIQLPHHLFFIIK